MGGSLGPFAERDEDVPADRHRDDEQSERELRAAPAAAERSVAPRSRCGLRGRGTRRRLARRGRRAFLTGGRGSCASCVVVVVVVVVVLVASVWRCTTKSVRSRANPATLLVWTRSRSSWGRIATGTPVCCVDGRVPTEHAAGDALVDHDFGAGDADEVRAAGVPPDRGGGRAEDEEKGEENEEQRCGPPAGASPARAAGAAPVGSGGSGGAITADRDVGRGSPRGSAASRAPWARRRRRGRSRARR